MGEDYENLLKDALDQLPEDNPQKQARLTDMQKSEAAGNYENQARWIGKLLEN